MKLRLSDFKRLWAYSVGFYGVWIAHIGRQMGLFDQIAKSPITVDDLIASTGFYPLAVQTWCSAALSYGFIRKKTGDGTLHITERMKRLILDKTNPDYLGGQFSYLALRSLEYGNFENLFRKGRIREMTLTLSAIEEATEWEHYAFLTAIKRNNNEKLHSLLSKGCRLLDVGCGTGSFLRKLCNSYPSSVFVGIDPSQLAFRKATEMTKDKPVKILRLAGEEMKFYDEFDIVYLCESLYPAGNRQKLVSNCYRALKKEAWWP